MNAYRKEEVTQWDLTGLNCGLKRKKGGNSGGDRWNEARVVKF